MVQKEGEVKILNAKISSLEKQKVVYATFNVCFQLFSCKPVFYAQVYSNSFKPFGGKEKQSVARISSLLAYSALTELDLLILGLSVRLGSLNAMELHLSVNESTAWKISVSTKVASKPALSQITNNGTTFAKCFSG